MRVALVYVLPLVEPEKYLPAAKKFVQSYLQFPGSFKKPELHVVLNVEDGDLMNAMDAQDIFMPLQPQFHSHNNFGKDLGAFILAARHIDCDLLVCMGAHVNFWKPGWLDVITSTYAAIGPAVYGAWAFQVPTPHIRTTFFWLPPMILACYPYLQSNADRYSFEHGPHSISLWSKKLGFEPWQVTWKGAYRLPQWHPLPLEEALARDQHSLRDFGE